MSLPLETAESPFKNKVLVDGNQLDISNINCYLQLLAQTANKKEKLRRKRRRERREKRKGNSSKERRRSKKERDGKEKEIEPDIALPDVHIKSEPLGPNTDQHGLTVAPTLPSQSVHPNGAMGRRATSTPITPTPVSASDLAFDHSQPTHMTFAPPSRSSSWSQFIIDHAQQQDFAGSFLGAPSHLMANHQQFLQSSSPAALYNNVGQPYMQLPQQQFDPAAEFIQFMTEHQSCSNPSFTFSSSFSSDALSPVSDESFMGFPLVSSTPSPYIGQHVPTAGFPVMAPQADPMQAQVQMHHQPQQSSAFYPEYAGLLSTQTPTSSFGMEPIDDRDGTFASLEFLEAALAQDIQDA